MSNLTFSLVVWLFILFWFTVNWAESAVSPAEKKYIGMYVKKSMTYLWTSLNARSADRRSSWIWSLSWANFSFSISCKDYKTKTNIQYWFLFIKVKLFWNLEPKFSKRFAEIRNLNMLMAVMTPPDPLKWPKTPQSRPGWLKSTYLVTLI